MALAADAAAAAAAAAAVGPPSEYVVAAARLDVRPRQRDVVGYTAARTPRLTPGSRLRSHGGGAVSVLLCEDGYPGWITQEAAAGLRPAPDGCEEPAADGEGLAAGSARRAAVLFALAALAARNLYLWGGTVGPDYDCSGLMQRAFASAGVWIPRDAYQQEAFLDPVARQDVQPGDLIFFGRGKATHVGLCSAVERGTQAAESAPLQVNLPEAAPNRAKSSGTGVCNNNEVIMYVHSSSAEYGHGKIAVDSLTADGGTVARHYFSMLRGFGRVTSSLKSSCLALANASTTART
eukprot:SM000026S09000  [mRNA]  locus=s26:908086:909796:+ [translate_table: standard]